jgi:hypothetical protein
MQNLTYMFRDGSLTLNEHISVQSSCKTQKMHADTFIKPNSKQFILR